MKEIIRLNEEQLRKMVNESIKKKIIETMGINDEMESESSSLVHFIQKNIRKAPIEYDEDLNQNYHILTYDHQFENKKFHIYAVSTIEEGIEVLTGVPAGRKDKDGNFPAGTINYLAYEKLKKFAKICEK